MVGSGSGRTRSCPVPARGGLATMPAHEDRRVREARPDREPAHLPRLESPRPQWSGRAQRRRQERHRGGAAPQGRRRWRGRRRVDGTDSTRPNRCGPHWRSAPTGPCSSATPPRRVPTCSRRARCWRRCSSARAPTSCCSANRRATAPAQCSGPRSPNCCSSRSSRRPPRSRCRMGP